MSDASDFDDACAECWPGAVEDCVDSADNDGDGAADCDDTDCATAGCPEGSCHDGLDNDADATIDCEDADCLDACVESACTNGADDDADGGADCEDEDCWVDGRCIDRVTLDAGRIDVSRGYFMSMSYDARGGGHACASLPPVMEWLSMNMQSSGWVRVEGTDLEGSVVMLDGSTPTRCRWAADGVVGEGSAWSRTAPGTWAMVYLSHTGFRTTGACGMREEDLPAYVPMSGYTFFPSGGSSWFDGAPTSITGSDFRTFVTETERCYTFSGGYEASWPFTAYARYSMQWTRTWVVDPVGGNLDPWW